MSRVKIDIPNKLMEIEGEESFIREIYDKSRPLFVLLNHAESLTNKKETVIVKSQRKTGSLKESYSIVKNIDFNEPQSLKTFFTSKKPRSALEKNAIFVYYLDKIAMLKSISLNHIYTCYKEVGEKMPQALKQSLADTASKKGWIDTKSMANIKITLKGESLVEHELS